MKQPIEFVALESASLSKEGIFDFLFGKKKEDETPSMKRLEKLEAEAKLREFPCGKRSLPPVVHRHLGQTIFPSRYQHPGPQLARKGRKGISCLAKRDQRRTQALLRQGSLKACPQPFL